MSEPDTIPEPTTPPDTIAPAEAAPKRAKRKQWLLLLVLAGIVGGALAVVSSNDQAMPPPTITVPKAPLELSKAQEIELGNQLHAGFVKLKGGLSTDKAMQATISRIGGMIAERTSAGKEGWEFSFHLLKDPVPIALYSLPGGRIYITPHLINRMKTEGQLASIIAHGMAHVVDRHPARHLLKQLDEDGGIPEGKEADILDALTTLAYTPSEEAEADALTVQLMGDTGYHVASYIDMLQLLSDAHWGGTVVAFFADHASAQNRVAIIKSEIAKKYPDGVPDALSK